MQIPDVTLRRLFFPILSVCVFPMIGSNGGRGREPGAEMPEITPIIRTILMMISDSNAASTFFLLLGCNSCLSLSVQPFDAGELCS